MKLWLVLLQWGIVGGTVGPLPYSEADCHVKVEELRILTQTVPESRFGFMAVCEYRDTRRELGSSYS